MEWADGPDLDNFILLVAGGLLVLEDEARADGGTGDCGGAGETGS